MNSKPQTHSFFFLLIILSVSCAPEATDESQLGEIHITVSGADEAQPYFEKGLLLLHSFEYADAREAFKQAQAIDTNSVMAYWGEAMTHNHNLWQQQAYEKAIETLARLGSSPEERIQKAQTELEKDFMRAVEVLYGEGKKTERDVAYRDFMAELYKKYPESHEVASFYALSLLGAVSVGRDDDEYGKGARIAQGILAENPQHPGALHYLIHAYDDPYHANLALQAANKYSKVAPDASHALHMPSHIYVAMGMWKEVVASNEASWQSSVDRMIRKELDNDARSYHALHWLLYGYLQQERYAICQQLMTDMVKYVEEKASKRGRAYLISMKAAFLVETEDWENEVADITSDRDDLNISVRAKFNFLEGMKAYYRNDTASLRQTLVSMETERSIAALEAKEGAIAMCNVAGWASDINQLDIDQAEVMAMELRALYATSKDRLKEAEDWLKAASSLEARISYAYGPPVIAKPSHELYGEWLLTQNRFEDAANLFDQALERGPKRILSLKGRSKAAVALKDQATVDAITKELENIQQAVSESSIFSER